MCGLSALTSILYVEAIVCVPVTVWQLRLFITSISIAFMRTCESEMCTHI